MGIKRFLRISIVFLNRRAIDVIALKKLLPLDDKTSALVYVKAIVAEAASLNIYVVKASVTKSLHSLLTMPAESIR